VPVAITIALLIASVKGGLVASYFMHLISERKMIYTIMGFTAFFFIGLMFLTLSSFGDLPWHTVTH
jgi:caa(3)-type oxidase subunit IV